MSHVTDTMERDYVGSNLNIRNGPYEFKHKLKRAVEEGLLIFIKYSLVLILAWFAVNYLTRINQAALNGEQAAVAIQMFQQKGYLPQFANGQLPDKTNKLIAEEIKESDVKKIK